MAFTMLVFPFQENKIKAVHLLSTMTTPVPWLSRSPVSLLFLPQVFKISSTNVVYTRSKDSNGINNPDYPVNEIY
jgi:hypothetical protein